MPDYIDTREGWREVTSFTDPDFNSARLLWTEPGSTTRCWVREAPVPPLPTEPFVMFRVHYSDGKHVLAWISPEPQGTARTVAGRTLEEANAEHPRITGFEVLAEPRAGAVKRAEESARRLTVKAVLDRVHAERMNHVLLDEDIDAIAREFGVSS